MAEEYEGGDGDGLQIPPSFFPQERAEDDREALRVTLEGIYKSEVLGQVQHFVRLDAQDQSLSIVIGGFEAQAILLPLQDVRSDRPMTHDLVRAMIDRLGGHVVKVTIDDLWNDVYYAKLHLKHAEDIFEIDARPSDAIAMAVRYDAPIFIKPRVFEIAEGYEVD